MKNKDKGELLKTFINANNLSFECGTRNSDSVILSGYALHLGLRTLPTIVEAVNSVCDDADYGFEEELERVFDFAKENNYGVFWRTPAARKQYTF